MSKCPGGKEWKIEGIAALWPVEPENSGSGITKLGHLWRDTPVVPPCGGHGRWTLIREMPCK